MLDEEPEDDSTKFLLESFVFEHGEGRRQVEGLIDTDCIKVALNDMELVQKVDDSVAISLSEGPGRDQPRENAWVAPNPSDVKHFQKLMQVGIRNLQANIHIIFDE